MILNWSSIEPPFARPFLYTETCAMSYQRADTTWFAACRFGIALHWTAQSMPVSGPQKSFGDAVNTLDVQALVARVGDGGARLVTFYGYRCLANAARSLRRRGGLTALIHWMLRVRLKPSPPNSMDFNFHCNALGPWS